MARVMINRDAYEVLQVDPQAHQLVIQAAYRVLAALYHPDRDQSEASTHRMAQLNAAYAQVRTVERRELYDRQRKQRAGVAANVITPYGPVAPRSSSATAGKDVLDFGRYSGMTIAQLARQDPDYLRWLERHSSGIRYRSQIDAALRQVSPRASSAPGGRPRR